MKLKTIFAALLLTLFAAGGYANDENSIAAGKAAFTMHCARCHGAEGKGDGPDAKRLVVAPRDLTSGKFKFKSTVQSTPPSDEDLIKGVIGHGLAGSGMPSFGNLDPAVRANIVAYIKTISPAFQSGQKSQPLELPANYRGKPDLVKGKEVFTKMQCGSCHGANGHANGASAATLVDAWGRPIKAANLTQGWTYRGGHTPLDIYHRILAGIEGAPMPSYEGAATHEEIWDMCNYVASLQLKTNWSGRIDAEKIAGELPIKLDDAQWEKAARTDINLQNFLYENSRPIDLTVKAVSVQAVMNDQAIALRIFWEDPYEDRARNASDALLVALKPVDYDGDIRGTLPNLYSSDAPSLDMNFWKSANAQQAGQKRSNLAAVSNPSWNPANVLQAVSSFEDGRWSLLITRPLVLDGATTLKEGEFVSIGFAAWDAHNKETGLQHSASEWIHLNLGESAHHE